jgi:hypothetical protein
MRHLDTKTDICRGKMRCHVHKEAEIEVAMDYDKSRSPACGATKNW